MAKELLGIDADDTDAQGDMIDHETNRSNETLEPLQDTAMGVNEPDQAEPGESLPPAEAATEAEAEAETEAETEAEAEAETARPAAQETPADTHGPYMAFIQTFLETLSANGKVKEKTSGKDISFQITFQDNDESCYMHFNKGQINAGLGTFPAGAEVNLRIPIVIFDGMMRGTVNGAKAAMTGQMAFTGNVRKVMRMQSILNLMMGSYQAALEKAAPAEAKPISQGQRIEISRAPKMVLFDFGGTLAWEPESDGLRGGEALLRHCTKNPLGLDGQDLFRRAVALWQELSAPAQRADREIHEFQSLRLRNELLGLEYSIPPQQQELVFWEAYTPLVPTPEIDELLAHLDVCGIRKGVVSNIGFSGETLTARLAQALPERRFEFVLASSDYGVRKPDPLLFKLALAKADLPPEDIWFCGDSPRCDVAGAHAAGMLPVWYEALASNHAPQCPHLHIHGWQELIQILKELT